jgi:hypothetical protein
VIVEGGESDFFKEKTAFVTRQCSYVLCICFTTWLGTST